MMKQEIEQKLEEAGRSMVTSLIYKMICDKITFHMFIHS